MKINLFNETKAKIPIEIIRKIESVISRNKELKMPGNSGINLITKQAKSISKLNREIFDRDSSTDVISVLKPIAEKRQGRIEMGDIYICPKLIKSNTKKYNASYKVELARVIIHGILHLLGYDHKYPFGRSDEAIFKIQEKLLGEINLSDK